MFSTGSLTTTSQWVKNLRSAEAPVFTLILCVWRWATYASRHVQAECLAHIVPQVLALGDWWNSCHLKTKPWRWPYRPWDIGLNRCSETLTVPFPCNTCPETNMKVNKVHWKRMEEGWGRLRCECCRNFAESTRPWFQWCRSATWQALHWRSCRTSMSPTKILTTFPKDEGFETQITSKRPSNKTRTYQLLRFHGSGIGSKIAFRECFGWFKLVDRIISTEQPGFFLCFVRSPNFEPCHILCFWHVPRATYMPYMYKSSFDWLVKKVWPYMTLLAISPACSAFSQNPVFWVAGPQELTYKTCLDIQLTAMTAMTCVF